METNIVAPEMRPQQILRIPTSTPVGAIPAQRSRRTGPLSGVGKIKAAAVRKKGACFRCAVLRIAVCKKATMNQYTPQNADNNLFNSVMIHDHVQNA